ncbi:MAG: sulfatase-like hydrolase/transferase [Pirellulaceae bacterium]|jgi:arylsulfatase A-like enzyme|nr:sulfatase-like hydrolase/transferase [Pirellulaceae bacterium]
MLRPAVLVMLIGSLLPIPGAAQESPRRPNVLLVVTDDQRADTIAALGNPHIHTPHLDQLARSGFVFRNAYCLGSNSPAVCLPSRNMLLSGRAYPRWEGRACASGDQPNLPVALKQAGYETWHIGKAGNVAREIHQRFDATRYLDDKACRTSGEHGKVAVDAAIAFLHARAATASPFFICLELEGPHDPRVAAPQYMNQYQVAALPLPANFLPVHPFDNGELSVRDELLEVTPRTPAAIRRHLHEYYACITCIDGHLGRLFQALQQLGEYERTVIVFTSDNGLAIGSHGLMGKQSLYEHSMKVPLIVAGPGIAPGSSEALVYLLDVFPTLCELAGTPPPPAVDGRSLAGIIAGRTSRVRDVLGLAYRDVQRAVRDERWKLIVYPQIDKQQLFDLQHDPDELHDLSGDPAHRQRVAQLAEMLRHWQAEFGL